MLPNINRLILKLIILKNYSSIFFVLFVSLVLFISCSRICIEPRGIQSAALVIKFFNAINNQYIYPEDNNLSPFNTDSLQVKDSNGRLLTTSFNLDQDSINPLRRYYLVNIYPIFIPSDDDGSYNSEKSKDIYIRYNYQTFDTLKLVYKAKKEKCADLYQYLKVYYKNNLIGEAYNSNGQGFVFSLKHRN